jgi:NAD(P)-dependent dehydrogenase (short-subunit alcohol dehydrogenase family)
MQGKVVMITGASQGIGAAAARVFAAAGAQVVLLARSEARIAALAAEIGPQAMALRCDVADWGQVEAAVASVVARFGRLDVLIGNAGVIEPIAELAKADPAEWGHAIDINLKGVFHGMRAALPVMRRQGAGTIITVSSGAAVNPIEGWSAYCASKAGALMLTRMAHHDEAPRGLRILGLSPGTVATEMQVKIRASGINPVSQLDPSVHVPAAWPARTLLWMCGPAADAWLGQDVSLRDEAVRRAVGLLA